MQIFDHLFTNFGGFINTTALYGDGRSVIPVGGKYFTNEVGFEGVDVGAICVFVLAEGDIDEMLKIGLLVSCGGGGEVFHHRSEVLGRLLVYMLIYLVYLI